MPNNTVFNNIYKDNYTIVFRYALEYIRDYDLAKDISQDVFIELWNNMNKVKIDKARSFLLTITRNKCLNVLRHNKIKIKFYKYKEHCDFNMMLNLSALEITSNDIYSKEISSLVDKVILEMPDFLSSTFYLSRINNLNNDEIAKKQNVSIRTIEYRIKKALLLINLALKDYRLK